MQVEIHRIVPDPDQPRKHFDQGGLEELAASMKQVGVLQALVVKRDGEQFRIVAGERRWRAATIAGLDTLPVVEIEGRDDELFVASVAENVNRMDMTVIEEAKAYQRIIDSGRTLEETASILGKSPKAVQGRLALLKLDPEIQDVVVRGGLSKGLASSMTELSVAGQRKVLQMVNRGEFTDDFDAMRFCAAVRMNEQSEVMFMIEDEETVERRREAKERIDSRMGKVRRLANALAEIEEISVEDLALGTDVEKLSIELNLLRKQVKSTEMHISRASALKKASV